MNLKELLDLQEDINSKLERMNSIMNVDCAFTYEEINTIIFLIEDVFISKSNGEKYEDDFINKLSRVQCILGNLVFNRKTEIPKPEGSSGKMFSIFERV